MATTKNLNVKIDADLKERAEIVFSELGLPTSTAITIFLKTVVRWGMSNILCKLLKIFVILFHQRSQPLINKHLVTDHCPVRQTM